MGPRAAEGAVGSWAPVSPKRRLAFASSGGFGAEVEKRLSAARAASLVLFYLIGVVDANVLRFPSHFFAKNFRFFPEINEKTPPPASRNGKTARFERFERRRYSAFEALSGDGGEEFRVLFQRSPPARDVL